MPMLFGCSGQLLAADPQVIADTDAAFQELAAGNETALLSRLPKQVAETPAQVRMIGLMRQLLPAAKASRYELVGWRTFAGTSGQQHTAVLRYTYDNGEHITATGLFQKPAEGGPWRMVSLNIGPSNAQEVAAPVVATSIGAQGRR